MTGIDHDLAQAIARKLRVVTDGKAPVSVSFRMYEWLALLGAPARNEVDFIISSISIKPEREELYGFRFTPAYHSTSQALVVRDEQEDELQTLDDLKRLTIAAQKGTTAAEAARLHLGDASATSHVARADGGGDHSWIEAANTHELLGLVVNGRADVAMLDYEIAQRHVGEDYPTLKTLRADSLKVAKENRAPVTAKSNSEFFDSYGMAVSQTQPALLNMINLALAALEQEGLDTLKARHLSPKLATGPIPDGARTAAAR